MTEFLICLVLVLAALLGDEIYHAPEIAWKGGATLPPPVDKIARGLNIGIVLIGATGIAAGLACGVLLIKWLVS